MNRSHVATATLLASVVTVVLLALCGCRSGGDGASAKVAKARVGPSGVPEVTVRAPNETALRAGFTEFFVGRGYAEAESRFTDEMVFDRPLGSSESARKAARVRLRYDRTRNGQWRVVAAAQSVESWKSPLETERTVTSAAKQMQGFLNYIKAKMEAQP